MYLTPLRSFKVPIRLQSYFPRLLGSSVSRHKRPAVAAPNPGGVQSLYVTRLAYVTLRHSVTRKLETGALVRTFRAFPSLIP